MHMRNYSPWPSRKLAHEHPAPVVIQAPSMVQEALVAELLEHLLSGSSEEQASAAQTVCELCCERRGCAQARLCRGLPFGIPVTLMSGCALPETKHMLWSL